MYVLSTRRYPPTRLHAAMTRIAKPKETAVARQLLCKHVSTVARSRDRRNGYKNATIEEL
jgi:hypothetical protein